MIIFWSTDDLWTLAGLGFMSGDVSVAATAAAPPMTGAVSSKLALSGVVRVSRAQDGDVGAAPSQDGVVK